jgi:hypothetical protein
MDLLMSSCKKIMVRHNSINDNYVCFLFVLENKESALTYRWIMRNMWGKKKRKVHITKRLKS